MSLLFVFVEGCNDDVDVDPYPQDTCDDDDTCKDPNYKCEDDDEDDDDEEEEEEEEIKTKRPNCKLKVIILKIQTNRY